MTIKKHPKLACSICGRKKWFWELTYYKSRKYCDDCFNRLVVEV